MPAYERLVERLPSPWRPEPADRTLVAHWLRSVAAAFDGAAADIQHVLRAHWFDTADAAAWAQHFAADRRERGLGALRLGDIGDRREALRYPYVRDLARLGALLDLPPWRDPASLREGVEEYRQRVADVLDAYCAGFVTPSALRRLVDAALPETMDAPPAARRLRYTLEEPVALRPATTPLVATPAVDEGSRVAPLARWRAAPGAAPGFVLCGIAPAAIGAASVNPMVELYTPDAAVKGIGIAFAGTLAPGQALRLAATRRHWLLRGAELLASAAETAQTAARDPSVNGPYAAAATASAGSGFTALAAAPDGSLWLVETGSDGSARVVRHDGSATAVVAADAPAAPYHAIACAGESAWLGTDAGLFRCRLWPEDGELRWQPVAGIVDAVRVLRPLPDAGALLAAGAGGVREIAADGSVRAARHGGLDITGHAADRGREWLASADALLVAVAGPDGARLWRYAAGGPSESLPDWVAAATPADAASNPLPPLRAVAVAPDGGLWLGGDAGLARWYAAADGTTRLEAFPDVVAGAVRQLAVDDRGLLWIAADSGLFVYDGRDLAQLDLDTGTWTPLGDAALVYPDAVSSEPRGFWRYDRTAAAWQRHDARAGRYGDPRLPLRAAPGAPVAGCAMLPSVRAELGSFDGSRFSADAGAPPPALVLRVKPDETRCLDGGLPYVPAVPAGTAASWRYLQLDAAPQPPALRPWWSTEGQLFVPPERAAPVPGHRRDDTVFLADAQREGQYDAAAFTYPPSAELWLAAPAQPAVGIRIRLLLADPGRPCDPALADRVWQLLARARPAGVPLQLMAEGTVLKESSP